MQKAERKPMSCLVTCMTGPRLVLHKCCFLDSDLQFVHDTKERPVFAVVAFECLSYKVSSAAPVAR